ncbi:hypothetical protein H4R18_000026 [Coemansia javaensis]|uniref:Uncharacterized protein n=1 Tax=Coemansia javaensis TaxID=2761396 RepID=A0A9W8LNK8_9FUNG|nr:hypothetical protein H4R18_000026 [Coemansia javaensis]
MHLASLLPRLLVLAALLAVVFACPVTPPKPQSKSCLSRVAAAITPANAAALNTLSAQLSSTKFRYVRMFEPAAVALGLPSAADFSANDPNAVDGALRSLESYLRLQVPEAVPQGKPCTDPLAASLLNIYKSVASLVNELAPQH